MVQRTVSNSTPMAILDALAARGLDTKDLLNEIGVSPDRLTTPQRRTPFEDVASLWEASYRLSNDRMIGISAVDHLPFGSFSVVDYLVTASRTLFEGMARALGYYPLINDGFNLRIKVDGKFGYVELCNPDDPSFLPFQYVDFVLACVLTRLRFSTGVDWNPAEVQLTCPEPIDAAGYSFFKAPIKFGSRINRIKMEKYTLEIPQPNADPRICELLDHHAREMLARLPLSTDVVAELELAIERSLKNGRNGLDNCARELGVSRRSLHRRLSFYGTSYRQVLSKIRSEIAQNLLSQNEKSIEEIAYLVGYSETSAFYKAFRCWTGTTPQQYRTQNSSVNGYEVAHFTNQ